MSLQNMSGSLYAQGAGCAAWKNLSTVKQMNFILPVYPVFTWNLIPYVAVFMKKDASKKKTA